MPRHPLPVLIAALLASVVAAGRGERPAAQAGGTPYGSGMILGQVVDGTSRAPLAGSVVTLSGRGLPPQRVVVDPRGRYVFAALAAGTYSIGATRAGYIGGAAGARQPQEPGQPVELRGGQRIDELTLRLWKLGVVSGAATTDPGEPAVGLDVLAFERTVIGGTWRFALAGTTTTDDRGRYRLTGLAPGKYLVVARPAQDPETPLLLAMLSPDPATSLDVLAGVMTTPRQSPEVDARVKHYQTVFYSGAATSRQARLISVDIDRDARGIDFHLTAAAGARISGTVTGSTDVEGMTVRLVPETAAADRLPLDVAVAACDAERRFELTNVAPGHYVLDVLQPPAPVTPAPGPAPPGPPPLPAGHTWWADVPVVVGKSNVTGVDVSLHRGFRVSGRLEFRGVLPTPAPQQLEQVAVRLEPVDRAAQGPAANWRGRVGPDGRFTTLEVPPGQYVLRVSTPPRWTLESATLDGHDILDTSFTIDSKDLDGAVVTFVDRPPAVLSGAVTDASEAVATDAVIVIFPAERAMWADSSPQARRLRIVRPTSAGAYAVAGLPAGDYFAAAIGEMPSDWPLATRLDALSRRATRVRLADGETRTLDLRVIK